ncbi:lysophospholipid acyltransferase family protein [Pseudoramibacter sp.]|jgi:1-acyl-sn-glycerol-3-phosphate acyltransferase|uniref:lysophospholipid acyltransferase family protein n=1 Tax=Pseudoramibacter sp. TaxID=2034862 RepID=UPI0025CE16C4|nr:lysophospholipid acyltransferase family protein [Pseudoramibacter sp.]MCH4072644.1 1-acyl-sn-glycerol-3-phosphate acyltransferase [Pseudoramibacter sp.]MCH4106415.1 1-acyl-sn-glycerol-3-phosphate acyltransferase [Pseudoramibacter sp.]
MIYRIAHVLFNIVNFFWLNITVEGEENVPDTGRAVICANHMYWYDPLLIDTVIKRPIRPVNFMAKAEIFKNKFVNWILKEVHVFPVERHKVSMTTLRTAMGILNNDELLGIFPEGTRVKPGQKVKPADGFLFFALKTKSPIVPVHIDGSYKFRGKIRVTFGKPIELKEYYGKRLTAQQNEKIGQEILDQIYQL